MDINIHIHHDSLHAKQKSPTLETLFKRAFNNSGFLSLICLIIVFTVSILFEFGIGLAIKNFHLMVDSLHNFLNILALSFSLVSTILSKIPNNERFTYGYSRLEIIAAFANCCFLVFLSLFLVFRGIHDVLESLHEGGHSHESSSQRFDLLLMFNTIRLCINIIGCIAFCRFSSLNSTQTSSLPTVGFFGKWYNKIITKQYKKYEDVSQTPGESFSHKGLSGSHHINFHSVFVTFMIGVIVHGTFISIHSIELLHETNFEILFAIALLIFAIKKTKPIFSLATDILLQALPASHENEIEKLLENIENIEGITKINSARYWALSPNYLVINIELTLGNILAKTQAEIKIKEILQEYFSEILIHVKV